MSYVTSAVLIAKIPSAFLLQALDDDADGVIDAAVVAQLLEDASGAVDALLCGRFTVPFADPPAVVTESAKVFACEQCYKRRGIADEANPWFSLAESMRAKLVKIASGDLPLAPEIERAQPSGKAITESVTTLASCGRRMA